MPEKTADGQTRIAVVGLGYVGCVTATCFAHLGHRVVGLDRDVFKVNAVLDGRAPFYEPGLDDLVALNREAGRLSATTSAAEALQDAEVVFVCVGTPSEPNGNLNLAHLRRASTEIAPMLAGRREKVIVAIRSTVFPGTCEALVADCFAECPLVSLVANPEFLREGNAVQDFLEPSLLVVGGSDSQSVAKVAGLYGPLGLEPSQTSLRNAEMIKYACNAFHALKIGFANEIGTVCGRLGIAGDEVMKILCWDVKLNSSAAYLKPGFAFGGSCLPKDLRAINYRATHLDLKLPLMESILPSNAQHLERAIQAILNLPVQRLGVFGLAFKANTDDLRESPVVTLLEQLIGKGREIRVFDPRIQLESIFGTNKDFLLRALPHIGKTLASDLDQLLGWAQAVIITQKPAVEATQKIRQSGLTIVDLSGSTPSKE
jgi:GDP-mannose 6-dehydrogenase